MGDRVMKPDLTPISRFPDLEKPERERLNQLLRLLILTTRGDLLTRGVTYLKRLALGTAGKVLHSDGTDVEWAVLQANEVAVEILSGADYDDVQDFINFFGNRTLLSGGTITTEGDGDAAMASCTAWCKVTDGDTAVGKFFNFDGVGNITLTDLVTNFIYLNYNGGTPQVVVATSVLTHGFKQDHIFVAAVYRSGTTLHIHQSDNIGIAGVNRAHLHHLEEFYVHRASGMVTSSVGTRQLSVDTGVLYAGLNRNTTNAFNTSTGDTFSYWYYDGDLGTPAWVEVAAQDAIDSANYNDVDTGLVAHSAAAKRGVHWVYMDNDGVHLHVVYGQEDYSTAGAELATVPSSLPPIVTGYCTLIAKIIVQKDQDILFISYPWTEAFQTSLATDHGSLAGLGDDDHILYILKSLLQNNSFVYRDNSGVLRNLFVGLRQMVGRTTTTELGSLTMAQVWANLSAQANAAVSLNNQKFVNIAAISELISSELTLDTDGAVAALRMFHTIDTFEDAASDDLVTISNAPKIAFVFIRPNNDARTVIVKHNTGNIWLQGKTDISLDDIEDGLLLAWDDDNSKWFDISIGAGAPPGAHDFGGVSHNADTLANFNSKVSDATLMDSIDEDNMASDLDTKVPTQQSVKAYADTKLADMVDDTTPQLGGDLDLNGNNIDFPTTADVSDCKDEDDMASDSATMLATQQSIKAYADLKAVKALSNLASVAINESLISDTNNTDDLGTDAKAWKDIHYDGDLTRLGTVGRIFVPITPSTIYRTYDNSVSTTPRTATVSSVAGDVITLTANEAYRFGTWNTSGSEMNGKTYLKIVNTTAPRAGEEAWVKNSAAVNTLTVTVAGDISGWQNGDVITTAKDGATSKHIELDISQLIPTIASGVMLKILVFDSGTITAFKGSALSKEGVSGTLLWGLVQVSGFQNVVYPNSPLAANSLCNIRDIATGTDTLGTDISVLGYFL